MKLRKVRRGDATPLHLQVERALRQLAADTTPGSLLPPEVDLAAALGVSRTTIRQAMQQLVAAGIVVRTAGRGTEVLDRHIETQLDFTPFVRAFEASGHDVRTAEATVVERAADDEEALALALDGGASVHELRRLRLVDGVAYALLKTVLPPHVPLPRDLSGSLYEHFTAEGIHLARLSDVVSSIGARRDVAKALGVRVGAPVLVIRRIAHDAAGDPVELTHTYLRSGAGYTVEHKR
jgi:GntR family transcriptional regulator